MVDRHRSDQSVRVKSEEVAKKSAWRKRSSMAPEGPRDSHPVWPGFCNRSKGSSLRTSTLEIRVRASISTMTYTHSWTLGPPVPFLGRKSLPTQRQEEDSPRGSQPPPFSVTLICRPLHISQSSLRESQLSP